MRKVLLDSVRGQSRGEPTHQAGFQMTRSAKMRTEERK